ncbi:helix-turn-helix transcriptional regulator [Aquicoccus sp. SU-CL01552]|uniref:helix-turn-helix domain-containing protein n=1 Tax=Aquicoccus sp. SU-CL01552 TaxID=3127656 RepID=UPI00310ACDA3
MSYKKPVVILAKEFGERLAAFRLSCNLRQSDIASKAGVSRGVIVRLEAGEGGTIDSLIRIMKAMDIEERLNWLVPDGRISPLDPRSELRQRARPLPDENKKNEPWSWGDE